MCINCGYSDCYEGELCVNMNQPHPEHAEGFDGCTCAYDGANCPHCREQAEGSSLGEWISVDDRLPEYYSLVWAFDGEDIFLSKLVGRSYTPALRMFRNIECNGIDDIWLVKYWMPCEKPAPPTTGEGEGR